MRFRRLAFSLTLSAAAALGFGQAWITTTAGEQQKTTSSKTSKDSDQSVSPEEALAHYIVVFYDADLMMNEQAGINLMEGSWINDSSNSLNSLSKGLTSTSAELKKVKFSDSKKENARKDLIHCNSQLAADFADMAKACHQATTNKGWDSKSTALANKAFGDSKSLPTDGSVGKLIKDSTFQKLPSTNVSRSTQPHPRRQRIQIGCEVLGSVSAPSRIRSAWRARRGFTTSEPG